MSSLPPPLDLLPSLLDGVGITVELTLAGIALMLPVSLAAGLARLASSRLVRAPATVFVQAFRGTSALVQLFWFYFALPFLGIDLGAMTAGILVLGLNTGAYGAEVVKGAVRAVPPGQREASKALGLSHSQTMRRIVLPQAALAMVPPMTNLMIELLKNTALVSMITLSELTFQAQLLRSSTLRTVEIFSLVLVVYFVLAQVIAGGMRLVERRLAKGRDHGGSA